jgi:hypothetical protein
MAAANPKIKTCAARWRGDRTIAGDSITLKKGACDG